MTRKDWLEAAGFFCIVSLLLGLGMAFLIEGMEPAAIIGTIPSWAFVLAIRFSHRKAPKITDPTREWFI